MTPSRARNWSRPSTTCCGSSCMCSSSTVGCSRAGPTPIARCRRFELPLPLPGRARARPRGGAGRRARLGADEGRGGAASCARRTLPSTRTRREAAAALRESLGSGGRCWRSATAARRPTRWTRWPTSSPPAVDGGRPAPRSISAPTPRSSPRSPTNRHRSDLRPPDHRLRPPRRHAAGAVDERQFAQRPRRARRSTPTRTGTIALVGYDGGRVASERLAEHVVITPSQHIPRIQEAQATAYHALRELAELG